MTQDLDSAVADFLAEYDDPGHAAMDWRLGYSVVADLLGDLGERTVLDYGCGSGRFARLMAGRGARVIAADISDEAIALARGRQSDGIDYHVLAGNRLDFLAPGAVDAAVENFVLCCMQSRDDLAAVSAEVARSLRPGGRWILCEPHPDAVGLEFVSMLRSGPSALAGGCPVTVRLLTDTQDGSTGRRSWTDYWHSREDYLAALAGAGLVVERTLEPLADPRPGEHFWKAERTHPPFLILAARKPG